METVAVLIRFLPAKDAKLGQNHGGPPSWVEGIRNNMNRTYSYRERAPGRGGSCDGARTWQPALQPIYYALVEVDGAFVLDRGGKGVKTTGTCLVDLCGIRYLNE